MIGVIYRALRSSGKSNWPRARFASMTGVDRLSRSRSKALTGESRSGRRAGAAQDPGENQTGDRRLGAVGLGHLGGVGLDLVLAIEGTT
jgi:hypothetical protein